MAAGWRMGSLAAIAALLMLAAGALAGTTGKIVGKVVDAETGEPLVGANVVLVGTTRGSATDLDGEFFVINLSPGRYDVRVSALGYSPAVYEGVKVSVDQTTNLAIELAPTVLEAAEAVTVTARVPTVKKDLTSSESRVDAEQLQMQPLDNLGEAVNLQAGVVEGHFRGGRSSEVAYMIDGMSVSDPYSASDPLGRTTSNQVEVAAIQEIQVISGTFNAEYGQAMSGIVNVVTRDGNAERYHQQLTLGIGDYVSDRSLSLGNYTPSPDRTDYMDDLDPMHFQDLQYNLSGPVPFTGGRTTFFGSYRYLYDHGRLYGQRIFLPPDSSNFASDDPDNWYVEKSGDGAVVTLDPYTKWSAQGKLTHHFSPTLKAFYSLLVDRMEYQSLEGRVNDPSEDPRLFKYNPEGNYDRFRSGQNHMVAVNHALSERTFYNVRTSYTRNTYQYWVHENPHSYDYVDPDRLQDAQNYAYYTGGQGMWHHDRATHRAGLKVDLTSQITKRHQVKTGFNLAQYLLSMEEFQLVWSDERNKQYINPRGSWNHQIYPSKDATSPLDGMPFNAEGYRPMEFSAYIQDKMEYDFMVVNFGVRFDYFHPDGIVPDDLSDPGNDRLIYYDSELDTTVTGLDPIAPVADPNSTDPATRYNYWRNKYSDAGAVTQFSPRIGISFPLTARGVLHFSYGHFFQIPPFQYLYHNPGFSVRGGPAMSLIGNAALRPERTVMYEVGLQQELSDGVALTLTGYYKDVRNLLGTEILKTYNQVQYARYINRDYANTRGVTLALDKRLQNYIGVSVDYTFQIAEGNASDPLQVYQYNQSDPPKEPEKKVRPLDWDQTHTLNGTFTFGDPSDWSIAFIGRLGSGMPYTSNPFLQPPGELNGARKPLVANVDMKAYKMFKFWELDCTLTLWVYNLFDLKNELEVWGDTGRATYTLERRQAAEVRGINTLDDYFTRPEWYSAPRQVRLVFSVAHTGFGS